MRNRQAARATQHVIGASKPLGKRCPSRRIGSDRFSRYSRACIDEVNAGTPRQPRGAVRRKLTERIPERIILNLLFRGATLADFGRPHRRNRHQERPHQHHEPRQPPQKSTATGLGLQAGGKSSAFQISGDIGGKQQNPGKSYTSSRVGSSRTNHSPARLAKGLRIPTAAGSRRLPLTARFERFSHTRRFRTPHSPHPNHFAPGDSTVGTSNS